MQKIFVLIKCEGIYDTSTSSPCAAFLRKDDADKECKRLNDEMDSLRKAFGELFEIDGDENFDFGEFIEDHLIIKILEDEYPEYYDFFIKTDKLASVNNDDPNEITLCDEICELIYDKYINDFDKLRRYAKKFYDDTIVKKVEVYTEYRKNCSYGDIYEGLPSYYVSSEGILLYD